jgi:hypothetical protein
MMFLANFIQAQGGDFAKWHSLDPEAQKTYKKYIESLKPTIVNQIKSAAKPIQ